MPFVVVNASLKGGTGERIGSAAALAYDQAAGVAKDFQPDIILLDVLMPTMNGWETLEKLRADAWGEKANVIMLTVVEDLEDVAHAVAKGSYEYLLKTDYNLDDVVKKVEASLKK